jgi:hypothetical protein
MANQEKQMSFKQGTQFMRDLEIPMKINGNDSLRGYYNLVVSIRDLKLFCAGMKPNRFWRLKDVKEYFGITGNKESVLADLKYALEVLQSDY